MPRKLRLRYRSTVHRKRMALAARRVADADRDLLARLLDALR